MVPAFPIRAITLPRMPGSLRSLRRRMRLFLAPGRSISETDGWPARAFAPLSGVFFLDRFMIDVLAFSGSRLKVAGSRSRSPASRCALRHQHVDDVRHDRHDQGSPYGGAE